MIEDLMKQLGEELEAPVEPEMPGLYTLPVEENLAVVVKKEEAGIALSCDVGPCPKIKREEFLEEMMLGNLFGEGTGDAALGLNEGGERMVLSQFLDPYCSYQEFSEALEDFLTIVDFWWEHAENHDGKKS